MFLLNKRSMKEVLLQLHINVNKYEYSLTFYQVLYSEAIMYVFL